MRILTGLIPVVLLAAPLDARAENSVWFDASNGCGRASAFSKSQHAADLPGCTGRLPKNAPQVEVLLQNAKKKLIDAEEYVGKNKLDKVDPLLAEVEAALAKSPPVHPELPDRWEQAEPMYRAEIATLRNRKKLASQMERVKTSYAAAQDAERPRKAGEPAPSPADVMRVARACVAVFAEVKSSGIDMKTPVELEKKATPRTLEELSGDCDRIRRTADERARGEELAYKTKRAKWRKALKGDRRKTFDAHPESLPEFDGSDTNWRAIARVPAWRYTTANGVETYSFKRDKLLGKTMAKK
jgi:hypothetical protein